MDIKFRIPEVWASKEPDDVIDALLTQIEELGLGEYVLGIQQYKHSIEILVNPLEVEKFLEVQINVEGCGFYLIANDEPVLFINVRGMKLSADWKEVVRVMSKYGRPVNYYEAKRTWRGREIRNGVRVVWIKCVDKEKIPDEWKKWEIPGNMIAPSKSGSSDDDSSFLYDFERNKNNSERKTPNSHSYDTGGYTFERTNHRIQRSQSVRRASQTSSTRMSVLRNCLWVLDQKQDE